MPLHQRKYIRRGRAIHCRQIDWDGIDGATMSLFAATHKILGVGNDFCRAIALKIAIKRGVIVKCLAAIALDQAEDRGITGLR